MPPDPRELACRRHTPGVGSFGGRPLSLTWRRSLAAYRPTGRATKAYHPQMMVALILYCYAGYPLVAGRSRSPPGIVGARLILRLSAC